VGDFFSNFVAVSENLNFKAAKIEKNLPLGFVIFVPGNVKTKWEIFSNFVAFS
jgi:hypothetical protein